MPFRGTLANLKKFSKAKCEVLHLDCGNPRHVYRSGKEVMERNPAKKDLGMVVGGKLNMSQQYELTAQKAKGIQRSVAKQVEGVYSSFLLCSYEIPPGVLHSVLVCPEGHGTVGASPEKGQNVD